MAALSVEVTVILIVGAQQSWVRLSLAQKPLVGFGALTLEATI
eukprot:COSAG05_NODE_19357_length_294_cov_0.676923_1_plen_42_part_10